MIRWLVLGLFVCSAFVAAAQTITPQIGGGIGFTFDGGISKSSGPTVCGGYRGPGDVAPGAVIGAAIRAWKATLCGQAFANITVSGVSADMLTSATTGALVPQTINGSVCPNASTTLCVLTKWYDQTKSNACSGPCDYVKTSTEQLGVLTTTCPLPLTACIVFPTSGATFNQVAGNFTATAPFTVSVMTNYTFGGSGGGVYAGGFSGSGGGAGINHGSVAGQATYSCDGTNFPTATTTDGSWYSQGLLCGTSTMQLYLNGSGQGVQALTPSLTSNQTYVGGIFGAGPTISETEVGIWNKDVTANLVALNTNQRNFYGFVVAGDTFWDSVAGSDANNCLTSGAPCQTIAKMKALNYSGGHAINWKGGSNFTGCLALSSGNVSGTSAARPITIQQYSTGAAPIISPNCGTGQGNKSAGLVFDSISAVVNGISVTGAGLGTGTQLDYCIAAQNSSGVGTPTVIIENTTVTGCDNLIWVSGFAEVAGFPGVCGNLTSSILNNTIKGLTQLSLNGTGVGGSGCGGVGNDTLTSQGNLYFFIGGNPANTGADQGSGAGYNGPTAGSVMQFELAHDNGGNGNTCGNTFALWQASTSGTVEQFSEAYNHGNFTTATSANCDSGGYDLDLSTIGDVVQYVYSHHNYGPAWLMFVGYTGNVFRYSVSENDQWGTSNVNSNDSNGVISLNTTLSSFSMYNLTTFLNGTFAGSSTKSATCVGVIGGNSNPAAGLLANNICYTSTPNGSGETTMIAGMNSSDTLTGLTMENNDYFYAGGGTLLFAYEWVFTNYNTLALFQAGTSQEVNSITTNPSTGTWTVSGNCTWTPSSQATWPPSGCPSSYSTVSGAVKGTGIAVSSPGTRDYYANTVPRAGPLWNMGAYGGP